MLSLVSFLCFVGYTSGATVVDDPNDGVLWDVTYQLDEAYNVNGRSRIFHVAYPDVHTYENDPALLHFHGGFGDGKSSAESTGFTDIAGSEGFLVVYGVGYSRKWSGGACCGDCATNAEDPCYVDDVAYAQGVLAALEEEKLLNSSSSVFASGHSNGGYMAYRLSCEMRDRIHGIAVVAGSPGFYNADACLYDCDDDAKLCYNSSRAQCSENAWSHLLPQFYECDTSSPLPALTFQGYADWHMLPDGGKCLECHGNMSTIPYSFEVKENAKANSCNEAIPAERSFYNISTANNNDISECWTYQECESNTTYCIQHIGGHAWPGNTYSECDESSPDYDLQNCVEIIQSFGPQIESLHASVVIVEYFESILAISDDSDSSTSSSDDKDLMIVIITASVGFFMLAVISFVVFRLFKKRIKLSDGSKSRLTEISTVLSSSS